MTNITTKPDSSQPAAELAVDLFDNWFDPIETEVRARAREFIEELIRGELDAMLAHPRYGRSQIAGSEEETGVAGHRHGCRTRSLTGTFGPIEIAVPRARLNTPDGKTTEWKSKALEARLSELNPSQEIVAYCRGPYCVLSYEAVYTENLNPNVVVMKSTKDCA